MKQKLAVFFIFALVTAALVLLNAATYTQKERAPDDEFSPNRSTYNSGSTGTQAFYALLAESGRNVARWQSSTADLAAATRNRPDTFVIIGTPRIEITDLETSDILKWVAAGGRLVMIDRDPPEKLLISDPWTLFSRSPSQASPDAADRSLPLDSNAMTSGVAAAKAAQPTAYTSSVIAVQPSRLASEISFSRKATFPAEYDEETDDHSGAEDAEGTHDFYEPPASLSNANSEGRRFAFQANVRNKGVQGDQNAPPPPVKAPQGSGSVSGTATSIGGPVVHIASGDKNIVVSVPYGSGEIVAVSDPFIVSNVGIRLVDNARLAVNLVSGRSGVIAFDEYHQGYGSNSNRLLQYFDGTPVISIFIQLAALVALVLFSQSRRFARALPAGEENRLSKLEYVAAMAELQQRTNAYDLAIENIYGEFRRRAARLVGVDNTTVKRSDLAKLIAERVETPEQEIDEMMFKCEDIIRGERTSRTETVELVGRIRALESALGLARTARVRI